MSEEMLHFNTLDEYVQHIPTTIVASVPYVGEKCEIEYEDGNGKTLVIPLTQGMYFAYFSTTDYDIYRQMGFPKIDRSPNEYVEYGVQYALKYPDFPQLRLARNVKSMSFEIPFEDSEAAYEYLGEKVVEQYVANGKHLRNALVIGDDANSFCELSLESLTRLYLFAKRMEAYEMCAELHKYMVE